MSEVKVTRKKTAETVGRSFPELFAQMPFVAIPLGMIRGVAEGVDHVFGVTPGAQAGSWTPPIDCEEYGGNLIVTAELPGLKKEDLTVEIVDSSLVIKGEHDREHKAEQKGLYRQERRHGQFYRSIPLPEGAKTDHMKAELHDGVLKVSMPFVEKKGRRIPVDKPVAA
jgi:HSP20 family protein